MRHSSKQIFQLKILIMWWKVCAAKVDYSCKEFIYCSASDRELLCKYHLVDVEKGHGRVKSHISNAFFLEQLWRVGSCNCYRFWWPAGCVDVCSVRSWREMLHNKLIHASMRFHVLYRKWLVTTCIIWSLRAFWKGLLRETVKLASGRDAGIYLIQVNWVNFSGIRIESITH